jgi:acyl-CoA synthetase (AMP-forming)/AMP-acid ligase II
MCELPPNSSHGKECCVTTRSCDTQGTIANSLTCVQLHKRAEKIAVMLMERGHLQDGDHVALVYPPGKEQDSDLRSGEVSICE